VDAAGRGVRARGQLDGPVDERLDDVSRARELEGARGESAGTVGVPEPDPARHESMTRRAADHAARRGRLRRAQAEGELPASADPDALAQFVTTFIDGIAVQASGGASRAQLRHAAAIALRLWPASGPAYEP